MAYPGASLWRSGLPFYPNNIRIPKRSALRANMTQLRVILARKKKNNPVSNQDWIGC
jgi:hypothetical protein